MKTQQKVRSKRTTTKKKAPANKRNRLRGSLPTEALGGRKMCDGKVVLFQRENSKRWQCRRQEHTGIWVDCSTKETDLEKAKKEGSRRTIPKYSVSTRNDACSMSLAVSGSRAPGP